MLILLPPMIEMVTCHDYPPHRHSTKFVRTKMGQYAFVDTLCCSCVLICNHETKSSRIVVTCTKKRVWEPKTGSTIEDEPIWFMNRTVWLDKFKILVIGTGLTGTGLESLLKNMPPVVTCVVTFNPTLNIRGWDFTWKYFLRFWVYWKMT